MTAANHTVIFREKKFHEQGNLYWLLTVNKVVFK